MHATVAGRASTTEHSIHEVLISCGFKTLFFFEEKKLKTNKKQNNDQQPPDQRRHLSFCE